MHTFYVPTSFLREAGLLPQAVTQDQRRSGEHEAHRRVDDVLHVPLCGFCTKIAGRADKLPGDSRATINWM